MQRHTQKIITGLLAVTGLALGGCFQAEYVPDASGIYYCQTNAACDANEACELFRCVSNEGPELTINGPEAKQKIDEGAPLSLAVQGSGLDLVESGQSREGEGYLEVRIDGNTVGNPIVSGDLSEAVTKTLDLEGLEPGAHRLRVQAFRSDGTAYDNPAATANQLFFIDDKDVHMAIIEPLPGAKHRVGETLSVTVTAINFTWKDGQNDDDCTEINIEDGACMERTDAGHTHVYVLEDYPGCLDPANSSEGCNFSYVNSLKPASDEDGDEVTGTLEYDFTETGTITLSAGLQYNEHEPFPNAVQVKFDQVEIEIVD